MAFDNSYLKARDLLEKHGQSHILSFWNQLNQEQRDNLLAQIDSLAFDKIDDWIGNFVINHDFTAINMDFKPVRYYDLGANEPDLKEKFDYAVRIGKELITQGKVGAFVVAGGQGTRLGFDGPKGDFPLSPIKKKTLFQLFSESIKAVSARYQVNCPWYIMTSTINHNDTVKIFQSNDYYGLEKKNIFIFQQGTMPNFSPDGKILLADKDTISCSPDGHGGSLKALYQSGAVDDMHKRGVELLSYFQVDNPLINIFDPLFIGLHVLDEAEMSSKALKKADPQEKMGNFCVVDGKITVIEYSDLPDKLAFKTNKDGSYVFHLGNIAVHIINRQFIERLNTGHFSLPLHRAVKPIRHLDRQGNIIESDGIKLETFVFDSLPLASKSMVLETLRSEEFAPVKNATGVDSVESARKMMVERAAGWLESAEIIVPRKPDGSPDCLIEIAPSFALEKDDIKAKLDQIPEIKPKSSIYLE